MQEQPQTGVCILRVERQPASLLITVSTATHLDRHLRAVPAAAPRHFKDADEALAAVAEFLQEFSD